MTAPVGLVDVEEEIEYVEITGLPIAEVTCDRCGAVEVILPLTHQPSIWCGSCRPALVAFPDPDPEMYPALAGPGAWLPETPWQITYGLEPKPKAEKVVPGGHSFPEPEVTSRDGWDQGAEPTPLAVRKQAQKAARAGWETKVQRSRGCLPHALHGTPGAVKTLFALIVRKGGASAYAVHDGTKWSSVVTWGAGAPWFAGMASVTDLGEYLLADGNMPPSWYAAIRRREAGKVAKVKTREECNRGLHKGAKLLDGVWTCPLCENTWKAGAAAWRRASTTEKETAR